MTERRIMIRLIVTNTRRFVRPVSVKLHDGEYIPEEFDSMNFDRVCMVFDLVQRLPCMVPFNE